MSRDSPFPELVAYWPEDIEIEDPLSPTTRLLHERDMRTLVLLAIKDLTLREIGVAGCDYFLKSLAKLCYSRAKHARVVFRLALALAVVHESLPRNPMDHVSRLHCKKTIPDAITIDQIQDILAAIRTWESRWRQRGPRPDRQLGQIVEVMLGTSARICEVLAIRAHDLDPSSPLPTVRIAGTIISSKGEPTPRKSHPKTERSLRRVALPFFALPAIRSRLIHVCLADDPEALLFATRVGTTHTTNNVRRLLPDVMESARIEGVTPHRFRRTVATVVNEVQGVLLASELLGHTDPRDTMPHYIQRNEIVNPVTADFLE